MNQLITNRDNEPRCSTLLISESFNRRHSQVVRIVHKYKVFFSELGHIKKVKTSAKTKSIKEYLLNSNQVLLLLSILKNSDAIVNLKCEAIKAGSLITILKALNNFDFGESDQRYVYAAEDSNGNIKIGISNNPEERVKNLSLGNSVNLKLIFKREANEKGYKDEVLLHGKCEKYNIKSEWFTHEVVELLE